jgi:hypothetical protein
MDNTSKAIITLSIFVIIAISILMAINQTQPKEHETFNIQTQDDLTRIIDELAIRMWEEQIFLDMRDIHRLTSSDPEVKLIQLFSNDMNGQSNGKGTWDDGYSLTSRLPDGTRTWEEFSNNGTLLKSIRINDEPEKEILILLK